MIATRESIRPTVRIGRLEKAKIIRWFSLGIPIALSALLNIWNLAQNGYSNAYYSAAVQSMLQSWHNFFFASYDAGGFITVDKPPVALWLQAISAKIFGFSSLSLLLPEALAGVASVALVYFLVRRLFGTPAALIAAIAMAITPIAVAVERGNNTDTLLVFTLLLAAWAVTRAAERGKLGLLVLSMALLGVGFNIKMLAAFIVLPTFYLLYLVAAPLKWHKRLLHLTLATVVLFVVSFSWATAVELTPADQRPWIGGSQTNSVFDLALNYNGLGRVTGDEGNTVGGGNGGGNGGGAGNIGAPPQGNFQPRDGAMPNGAQPPGGNARGADGGNNSGSGMFNAGVAGPFRLFGSELASQWSWLFPLAGFGLLAALFALRRKLPLEAKGQALLLWTGWLVTYGVVFSMAEGIFHTYYLIMLAPAVAALVGIGVAALWKAYRDGGWHAWLLSISLLATAAWQVKVLNDYNYPQWSQWLVPITVAGGIISALALLASRLFTVRLWRRLAPVMLGVGLIAMLAAPLAWSITPAMAAGNGVMPTAGPSNSAGGMGMGMGQPNQSRTGGETANSGLISYLEANNDGYFYLVAVSSANQRSSIALETGLPVLAMGGFTGSDPAMTVEKVQALVASKQVKFVLTGGMGGSGGGSGGTSSINSWIQSNCTSVDSTLYGGSTSTGGMGGNGNSQLYNCAAR